MKLLVESWMLLLYLDLVLRCFGYRKLQALLRRKSIALRSSTGSAEDLMHAVDLACAFYFKRVFCLQRSAAAVILMRRHGMPASLVIGAQFLPSAAHAWVEADGVVLNERMYVVERYQVLERY
jgi:hypothetical protein